MDKAESTSIAAPTHLPGANSLACITPPRRFTTASATSRNPLAVQFWLLGIDAARGDLRRRGFDKLTTTFGSSMYALGDITLHSSGLWLRQHDMNLHYLRPRETFYQVPATHPHTPNPNLQPADGAPVVSVDVMACGFEVLSSLVVRGQALRQAF